jgi:hypothetical protein
MVDSARLCQAFASFLGADRFREFVRLLTGPEIYLGRPDEHWPPESIRAGYHHGLRYCQQQDWLRFTTTHREFAGSLDELARALRICEVHGRELLPDTVDVFHGCVDYVDSYVEDWIRLFPHAFPGPISTEGAPFNQNRVGVWYCSACREAEAEWNAQRLRLWGFFDTSGGADSAGLSAGANPPRD